MYEYLNDIDFLMKLDKANLRTHYAKIVLLSFDEKPIKEIQGTITAGTVTVNGSSSIRRTISLTMLASFENSGIDDIDNQISINKKIKVFVGLKNPFKSYEEYGDIIWFPQGLYVISSATVQRSTSGWNISISGKDKMVLLDGTVGGTLPMSITFHEREIDLEDGSIQIEYPTIFQIIYEAVNHWGGEAMEHIIISDLDETTKLLVKYVGDSPIYFSNEYKSFSFSEKTGFERKCVYGQDVGYKETDFTWPGELVLSPGDTVVTLLDKICDLLTNYEYFYDLDGNFIFQEIKNYLNTGSPLDELVAEDYVKSYDNAKYLYSLTDLDTTTAITVSPKYDQIKNDFYVWGRRETTSGVEVDIRYHLAIDTKPDINLAGKYMWEFKSNEGLLVKYDYTDSATKSSEQTKEESSLGGTYTLIAPALTAANYEWREELYRRALDAQCTTSVYDNYYDSEMIAEWRNLYWFEKDSSGSLVPTWNPDVSSDPKNINFWIDFIDTGSELGKYSIGEIGRRTKVENDTDLASVYNTDVPDVIFIEGLNQDLIEKYTTYGQQYFILTSEYYDLFQSSNTGSSCFDEIREMMYQNLAYNTTITITCLPKYYMEVNNIIHIEDKDSNINGNYQITQFTLPLAYSGTMSITATEVLTRV